jgi:hypothetical protein
LAVPYVEDTEPTEPKGKPNGHIVSVKICHKNLRSMRTTSSKFAFDLSELERRRSQTDEYYNISRLPI